MTLQTADLLFIPNNHEALDEAIATSTGNYVHVAIVINTQQIIDASAKHGVAIQRIRDFFEEVNVADIYRASLTETQQSQVISQAMSYQNRPYNFSFYPNDDGLYCSQLVQLAFANVLTIPQQPMQFGDDQQPISNYWLNYYQKLGVAVPLNQPGTNPHDLSKTPQLNYVGQLRYGDLLVD